MEGLHQLLTSSAERRPDGVAAEDPESASSISYRQLEAQARQVRDALLACGVAAGDRVAIHGPKSIDALAALLGTSWAGGAYVPLDPGAPLARNAYILADCKVRALMGPREQSEALIHELVGRASERWARSASLDRGLSLFAVEDHEAPRARPEPSRNPERERLAYILYTSGSTGRPKGVMHTHEGALSFLEWCSDTFEPTAEDRFSSHAPFHFDLSILDVFLALKHGATLVLLGEQLGKSPHLLAPLIAREGITFWYSTPSILRLLVQYGKLDRYDFSALRRVLFAGEVFPVKYLRALRQAWQSPTLYNLYGPTETNVCTYYELPSTIPPDRSEAFPIGASCSHCRTRVVDEKGDRVERGRRGELEVRGAPVMLGYWEQPERTAEAFSTDEAGRLWYRTGDVVREDAEERFEFLGRKDRMVKRLGYRVELGEIEAALHRHPQIAEAAVLARPDEETGVHLTAFVGSEASPRPSIIRLKSFCAEELPAYMTPDRFRFVASLPRTSTGKIDYPLLEELD